MIRSIEKRRSEVKHLIKAQEEAALIRSERLLKHLEEEIDELKKGVSKLEGLFQTEDHIDFLQSSQSVCVPSASAEFPSVTISPNCSFGILETPISNLKDQLEKILKEETFKISEIVKEIHVIEPRIREDFLQHVCKLTLDPNSVHNQLCLSEENTVVMLAENAQPYPDHPERFDSWQAVLCREGLSGCSYWEVEGTGRNGSHIAMSYKGIGRKGKDLNSLFGCNDKSWRLYCSPTSYSFCHNNEETPVSGPSSSTIGVYLDHRAGTLSFYSVSDTMTLLHRVQTTFTEPLYPGFYVNVGCTVKLCSLC
uniref:B30.2/SPRY domain-containing protein n=2 Tax=Scleropages formosus TaxID=113540 RepID=A0A8C9WG04_SCLFO